MKPKSIKWGISAAIMLLAIYFGTLSFIPGSAFAFNQFSRYWYFIIALATGFGLQVGLYVSLRELVLDRNGSGRVLAASGMTSTAAMISCCVHYLANILPIIAVTGIVSIVVQYQVQFFLVGLVFNFVGIAYMAKKVVTLHKNIK